MFRTRPVLVLIGFLTVVAANAQNVTIYEDTLQNGFQDYSYGDNLGDIDFASNTQVHGGASSISFIGRNFSAVAMAHPTQDFNTAQQSVVHLWVHGGAAGGQQLFINLEHNGVGVASGALDGYINGGSIAAGMWREVTVNLGAPPLSYNGPYDRVDLQSSAGVQPVLYLDDIALQSGGPPAVNMMQIEQGVPVGAMVSDRFTWFDATNKPRVAVLAHNNGQVGPTGIDGGYPNRGGALREFRYQMPDNTTRVVGVTTYGNAGQGGFGYVVSHRKEANAGGIGDDSPLGYAFTGSFQRVFEGRHHAVFRFTQLYPRYSRTNAVPPNTRYDVPVTIDWMFSTGRDHPLWAVTWDLSGVPVNALNDDSRAPYGEMLIDGAGGTNVQGVSWGDRFKFTTTTGNADVTLNSHWNWEAPNSVPYVKTWMAASNAAMGLVQTQTMSQQDAGGGRIPGYYDVRDFWGQNSLGGLMAGPGYRMPFQNEWPYQAMSYSLGLNSSTNYARLTWGTQYGFLGQASYAVNDSVLATASGWPKKSYSTHVVFGPHTLDPAAAQLGQVETHQSLTLTATTGTVVTSGPAGIADATAVMYQPAGYNHVRGALAFSATGNQLDANIAVGAGTLRKPLLIISNYTAGYPTAVKLNNVTLVADAGYFPSLNVAASELWITLNADLTGGANRLEILSVAPDSSPQALAVDAGGNGVLETGEDVMVAPSWRNDTAGDAALTGSMGTFNGPGGPVYTVTDAAANYGVVAAGATAPCADCYSLMVTGARPQQHWDASVLEQLNDGSQHTWALHLGNSFIDVPTTYPFYRFIETIFHQGVTLGCSTPDSYCPSSAVLRGPMAAFIARSLAGTDALVPPSGVANGQNYNCTAGGNSLFTDVSPTGTFCRHVHYIYGRNVTAGITATEFAPNNSTLRSQMAVFIARALVQPNGDAAIPPVYVDPVSGLAYDCTDGLPNNFPDVPDGSFGCKQIHYIWAKEIVTGFGDGTYGPNSLVVRGAMAKFLANAFQMKLYGP